MKKRIVSLLMAVCMLVLAVPVIALPATAAATGEFTTRFDKENNYPLYESQNYFERYVGNWSLGYLTENGISGDYRNFNAQDDIVNTSDINHWYGGTGFYLWKSQMILGFYPFYSNTQDDATGTPISNAKMNRRASTITYTSPYTGRATLTLDSFVTFDTDVSASAVDPAPAYFAIFVNGEMVWPFKGDHFSNVDKWQVLATLDEFISYTEAFPIVVDVNRGDKIQFACAKMAHAAETVTMYPVVTFDAGYSVVSSTQESSFAPSGNTWPEHYLVGGTFPLLQQDPNWQMGSFDSANKSFSPYMHQTNAIDVYAHTAPASEGDTPWTVNGGIYLHTTITDWVGGFKLGSSSTVTPAYMLDSYATAGTATPMVKSLKLTNASGGLVKSASAKILVYVNGELKGEETVTTNATTGVAALPTFDSFQINKGDKVVFTVKEASTGVSCVTLIPAVKYEGITSFLSQATTEQYAIAVEQTNLKVSGTGIAVEFKAYANLSLYDTASNVYIYVWEGDVEKTPENAVAKIAATCDMSYAYVAEYNGFAIAELGDTIFYQAVAVNGTTVLDASDIDTVVPATVALNTYNDINTKTEDKELMAALLNYGAYAQTYFGYKTDALVNAALPAADRVLDTEAKFEASYFVDPVGHHNICDADIGAFSLIFENSVSIRVYLDTFATEAGKPHYVQYGRTRADGADTGAKKYLVDGANSYVISDIGLDEMSQDFFVRAAVAYTTPGSARISYYYGYLSTYSVESYVARMIDLGTDAPLCDLLYAMMAFGDLVAAQ